MADFTVLKAYMDALHQEKGAPSGDVMVYHKGQLVYRYMTGYADDARTCPVNERTLYNMYSCSKPITVTAAMQLVESGKLELDAPVSRYLPEYADAFVIEDGQRVTVGDTMTVRHLFTMSAGLTYDTVSPSILAEREAHPDANTRQMVAAIIREPLAFRPGERFNYSLCHDVLAAVVEVVSGLRYGEYLQKNIFEPLGMTDIGFFPTEEQMSRMADQYYIDENRQVAWLDDKTCGGFRLAGQYESGGAGLFASTEAYGRFVAAMSCGGVAADGTRILRPETVDLIRSEQLSSYVHTDTFSCIAPPGYGYGLGVRTLVDKSAGAPSSLGEFGWDGAAGSYLLMDPAQQVGIVYTLHVRNWPALFGSMHLPLRDAVYEGLGL